MGDFMYDKKNDIHFHIKNIDPKTIHLVYELSKNPSVDPPVAVMPDAHPDGFGAVVGFTARFSDYVVPQIVGGDIGCGMATYPLKINNIDLGDFDQEIRNNIPIGSKIRKKSKPTVVKEIKDELVEKTYEFQKHTKSRYEIDFSLSLGTLGSGNHFFELNQSNDGLIYATVHTGSRLLGQRISGFFKKQAKDYCHKNKLEFKEGFEHLPMNQGGSEYIYYMKIGQQFAKLNRMMILEEVSRIVGSDFDRNMIIDSPHNYIDDEMVVRKGAISAKKGEDVIVALNMAEGIIIGEGKGRSDYNESAPHGLGRKFTRKAMRSMMESGEITLDDFHEKMREVYSTSIKRSTIAESPCAYKDYRDVIGHLKKTVRIKRINRPIYNLKA